MSFSIKSCIMLVVAFGGMLFSPEAVGQVDPYQAIVKRDFGTNADELTAIEKQIGETRPDQYAAIESKLLVVLESAEATFPAKQFACQMLRTVGSSKCIPAVSRLLTDEKLSHMARQVLLGMKDPAADEALLKALATTQGNTRIGIINTIGDRSASGSLAALGSLLSGADEATTRAALNAIGKVSGVAAADLLDKAGVADALKDDWAQAYLRCAVGLAESGETRRAESMFQSLQKSDRSPAIRAAAMAAVARLQKEAAVPLVISTLSSTEGIMRRAAITAAIAMPGNGATRALAAQLPGVSGEAKAMLLGALAARGDADGVADSINKLLADPDPVVRLAAVKAAARLGNVASVPGLVGAIKEPSPLGAEAMRALAELRAEGVGEALVKLSESGEPAIREAVFGVLAQRAQADALPSIRGSMADGDANVRRAAIRTLAVLGVKDDLPMLVDALLAAREDAERDALAQAISGIGGRMADKNARCEPVLAALSKAETPAKIRLLAILATFGGEQSLKAVKAALGGEAEVHKTAVRALSDWPDASPIADVLKLAREDKDKANQILALRGYIRMVPLAGGRPEQKLAGYRQALELAARPEEKRQILTGLGDIRSLESLKMVDPLLEDAAIKREAYSAYGKIAEGLGARQAAAAREALTKVAEKAPDAGTRNKARSALEKIK